MTNDELAHEIKEWIERSGYPLEMRVARAFRKVNPNVQQAWHFIDPITRSIRETDVVANWTVKLRTTLDQYDHVTIHVVAECKATTAPWIVMRDSMDIAYSSPEFLANRLIPGSLTKETIREISNLADAYNYRHLLAFESSIGYHVCEKRNTEKSKIDHAYAAAQQASSAAIGIIREAREERKKASSIGHWHSIAFPVVVTTSPLFEATMNQEGDMEIERVTESAITTRLFGEDDGNALVYIVSEQGLDSFVSRCHETARFFADQQDFTGRESAGIF